MIFQQDSALHVSYVDDLTLMLSTDAETLPHKLSFMAEVVHSEFRRYGLSVNFGTNKTEALVKLRGKGADKVQRDLQALDFSLPFKTGTHDMLRLRIVTHYVHMGSVITSSGSSFLEAKRRSGLTNDVLSRLGPRVFRNHEVSKETKCKLM